MKFSRVYSSYSLESPIYSAKWERAPFVSRPYSVIEVYRPFTFFLLTTIYMFTCWMFIYATPQKRTEQ